jgi:hypothetical protein
MEESMPWVVKQAKERLLEGADFAHPNVVNHWMKLAASRTEAER